MATPETLSYSEIEGRFDGEWVLLENPESTPLFEVTRGAILHHSKDRDEVYRKAVELRPKSSAIIYVGAFPENMAIIL